VRYRVSYLICLVCVIGWFARVGISSGARPTVAALEHARSLRQQGQKWFDEGKFQQAALAFAEAYTYSQRPLFLLLLARALNDSGKPREAGEFCQRFLQEQPDAKEIHEAKLCRSNGIRAGSGESLLELAGLTNNAMHDLNLADVYLLLGNYDASERFADHFLSYAAAGSPAYRHAVSLLRTSRRSQGKSDLYARGRRPLARVIAGALTIGLGIGLAAWGASALWLDSRCVGMPDRDPMQSPHCRKLNDTAPSGAALIGLGSAALLAGTITVALPGPPPERTLALVDSISQLSSTLTFHF